MIASGFLMVYQYRRRESVEPTASWGTAVGFWLRRFFRIAPVYYLFLLVLLIFWKEYAGGLKTLQLADPDHWAKLPIYNPDNYNVGWVNTFVHATFLFGILPKFAASNMSQDWSIGLEMQFYALFPLLYFIFRRISWIALLITSVISAVIINHLFAHLPGPIAGTSGLFSEPTFLLMKLPLFLIGMLCGQIFWDIREAPHRCAFMAITALMISAHYSLYVSIMTGIVLWLTLSISKPSNHPAIDHCFETLLNNRIANFMSEMSYSVYLLHGFFIAFIGGYLYRQPYFLKFAPSTRVLVLISLLLPVVYGFAWLLHLFIEKPGIRIGRRVVARWFAYFNQIHGSPTLANRERASQSSRK